MDVLMPQLGETVAEGKITKWFKTAGEAVKPGDNLFEIETDKVSMEVPSITAGVLAEIRVLAGETAPVGAVVAVISDGAGAATGPSAAPPTRVAPAKSPRSTGAAPSRSCTANAGFDSTPVPVKLDPFFEVRTPNTISVRRGCRAASPSRRWRAGSPPKPGSIFPARKVPARMAALSRKTSRMRRNPRAGMRSRKCRAQQRSWRSTRRTVTRKCRSMACAAPSRRG